MLHISRARALSDAAERRVSNQIARVYRGTYGARTGLRIIVRSLARQMFAAGMSQETAAQAFEDCVLNHPDRAGRDRHSIATGEAESAGIVQLTRECVAEVAADPHRGT